MVEIARKRKSSLNLPDGPIRIPHGRNDERVACISADTRIMASILQSLLAMSVASIQRKARCDMVTRRGKCAGDHEEGPCCMMCLQC